MIYHSRNVLVCDDCGRTFDNKNELMNHLCAAPPDEVFVKAVYDNGWNVDWEAVSKYDRSQVERTNEPTPEVDPKEISEYSSPFCAKSTMSYDGKWEKLFKIPLSEFGGIKRIVMELARKRCEAELAALEIQLDYACKAVSDEIETRRANMSEGKR